MKIRIYERRDDRFYSDAGTHRDRIGACGRGCDRPTTSAAIASGSVTARSPQVFVAFRVPIAGHVNAIQAPICTGRSESHVLSQPTRASVTKIAVTPAAAPDKRGESEAGTRVGLLPGEQLLERPGDPLPVFPDLGSAIQRRCWQ